MPSNGTNKTVIGVVAIIIIAVIVVAGGWITPSSFNFGASTGGGGGQQTPPSKAPSTGSDFVGNLLFTVNHKDALDNSESRTEATHITTLLYRSTDEVSFSNIGTASTAVGGTTTVVVDTAMSSIVYVSPQVVSGQAFYIAPNAIADPNLNPRIIDFFFKDITNDGQKEWVFKVDLHDMPAPVAGQTGSTLYFNALSYDDGATTLSAPANIASISTTAGTNTWIRWEQTVGVETADPVYEYEAKVNSTNTAKWNRGQTILSIPNIGDKSLSDFVESQDGTNTIYKLTLGSTLENANYVTTPQNGNTVKPIPLRFNSNFGSSEAYTVTLTIRSMTSAQGSTSVNDAVILST